MLDIDSLISLINEYDKEVPITTDMLIQILKDYKKNIDSNNK